MDWLRLSLAPRRHRFYIILYLTFFFFVSAESLFCKPFCLFVDEIRVCTITSTKCFGIKLKLQLFYRVSKAWVTDPLGCLLRF